MHESPSAQQASSYPWRSKLSIIPDVTFLQPSLAAWPLDSQILCQYHQDGTFHMITELFTHLFLPLTFYNDCRYV